MPMPAVPAMPISEYESAGCTFSMSRLAMRLPMVARRAPAMTTPSAVAIATMVVPCGARPAAIPGGSGRRPGSSSGDAWVRNCVKEDVPAFMKKSGRRPDGSKSLATWFLSDTCSHRRPHPRSAVAVAAQYPASGGGAKIGIDVFRPRETRAAHTGTRSGPSLRDPAHDGPHFSGYCPDRPRPDHPGNVVAARIRLRAKRDFPVREDQHLIPRIGRIASLTALLDIAADELLGVLLQDGVDLVQQVVDVLGDLRVALGHLRVGLDGDVLDLFRAAALLRLAAGVSGCHGCPPSSHPKSHNIGYQKPTSPR